MSEELNPSEYNHCSECRSSEQYEAKLEAEIERLREDNEVLLGESQRLHWDSKRLLGLLRECQDYVEAGMSSVDSELCDRIEREVGDV
jgi:hypothetical protein